MSDADLIKRASLPIVRIDQDGTRVIRVSQGLTGPTGPAAESAALSDADPAVLGVAAPGVSADASRADHVHPMPSAADVDADPAGTALDAMNAHLTAPDPHGQYLRATEGDAAYEPIGTASAGDAQHLLDYDHPALTAHIAATGNPHSTAPSDLGQDGATDGQAIIWDDATGQWTPGTVASYWTEDAVNGYLYPSDLTGNVGIGTDTPEHKLSVIRELNIQKQAIFADAPSSSTSLGVTYAGIYLANQKAINNNWVRLNFGTGHSNSVGAMGIQITDHANRYGKFFISSQGAGNHVSDVNLLIDETGNVGIGEITPTARLHVVGPGNDSLTYSTKFQDGDENTALSVRDDRAVFISTVESEPLDAGMETPAAGARLTVDWWDDTTGIYRRKQIDSLGVTDSAPLTHIAPCLVSELPSASTAGAGVRGMVTDANATAFGSVVAGSGANTVPVYSDGTDWRIG